METAKLEIIFIFLVRVQVEAEAQLILVVAVVRMYIELETLFIFQLIAQQEGLYLRVILVVLIISLERVVPPHIRLGIRFTFREIAPPMFMSQERAALQPLGRILMGRSTFLFQRSAIIL